MLLQEAGPEGKGAGLGQSDTTRIVLARVIRNGCLCNKLVLHAGGAGLGHSDTEAPAAPRPHAQAAFLSP